MCDLFAVISTNILVVSEIKIFISAKYPQFDEGF